MGKIRTNNEDAYIVQHIWDDDHILAVAIDGVGGYEGGEVAAALARKSIIEYLESYPNGERLELLKQAVVSANNTIFSERKNMQQYANMSCVLTAALIELKDRRINMAHVGDTRLYQFANGVLTKLSHDHSLVGYREEIGELTEEEAMKHPQRNIIGRDVGSRRLENGDNDYVEVSTFPLLSQSMLLLCSDGLCDMLTSAQMSSILQTDRRVEDKAAALIDAANAAGGKDNVTIVLIDFDMDDIPLMICTKEVPVNENIVNAKTRKQNSDVKSVATKKGCITLLIYGIILFLLGYFAGGFSAQKIMPLIFSRDGVKVELHIPSTHSENSAYVRSPNETNEKNNFQKLAQPVDRDYNEDFTTKLKIDNQTITQYEDSIKRLNTQINNLKNRIAEKDQEI